jgi:Flp pilus assembly pilin Flp
MLKRALLRRRSGQSMVEYMLYISVILIALAAAAYAIVGPLKAGYEDMADDASKVYTNGTASGSGDMR